MSEFSEAVLDYFCAQRIRVVMIFSLLLVALIISVLALIYFNPNSGPFAVTVLNLVAIVPLTVAFGYVLYACRERM